MKPSTSRTCTSKVGITNGSPAVRQRGNIGGLLGERGISRSTLESRDYDVKNTWRCSDDDWRTERTFFSDATQQDIVQWDSGSWPGGLPKKDGATALSGAGALDTATTHLNGTSRTKNLRIEESIA